MLKMECKFCRWWTVPADYDRYKAVPVDQAPCMFNPPVAALIPARSPLGEQSLQNVTYWPTPSASSRCNNFEPINNS